ncbi:hypothetical protein GN244_ATG17609 [Phytophthora infestans]|uniref:Uncharacterized protein n=1 Tax=Phytophthora infestans TaxID=4787 RepID=A0A833RQG7_PHYIN|nr:hypothetical protein GN244_ATG17609 [Phytophthora infestans]
MANIVQREKKLKQLKAPKFKGVDDAIPANTWLRSIQNEIKRQQVTLGGTWQEHLIYLEVAANFVGETLWWFGAIAASISEKNQTLTI